MRKVKRILVIMPNWIGDCLMAQPIAHILKDQLDNIFVGVLIHKRTVGLFKDNPYIDDITVYNDKENIFSRGKTIYRIGKKRFHTAIIFKPSFNQSLICKLAGIKTVIGPVSDKFNFINKPVNISKDIHKMDTYLKTVTSLGLRYQGYTEEFFLGKEANDKAKDILKDIPEGKIKIVLHPKANWLPKMWPVEHFARLADRLVDELGVSILISGSPEDVPIAEDIKKLMKNEPFIIAGKTDLKESAAVLKECELFISGDTGIMHLAASLGIRFIALFGPTSPELTFPKTKAEGELVFKNQECKVPCYLADCKDNRCMKDITVEDVLDRIKDVLAWQKK